jgi:polyisoprenoid-binding protein YceI
MSPTATVSRTRNAWDIDLSHSSIRFSVRHLNISTVHGRFDRWSGRVALDDSNIERSQVSARIEAASVNTNEPKRDAHLRSADFFDAVGHPEITFLSKHIEKSGTGGVHLSGDLCIAGVTRTIALEVEMLGHAKDPWGAERVVFSASTTIDRRDFGLVWSQALEAGGLLVGEKVEIGISIEAVRRTATPSAPPA